MKHIDYLQVALVANLVALFVAMVTAGILAWNNAGSKNIPLAVAALIGVMVGYTIQLPFELARSTTHETIGIEYTIDRATPEIRQWVYSEPTLPGSRLVAEVEASRWLARNNPGAFEQSTGRDKAALDFVIYSFVSYLWQVEFDWQLERRSYGAVTLWQPISRPEECSSFAASELQQKLGDAGNLFAGAPFQISARNLCLPPETELKIAADSLTLRNPFCQLVFKAEHPAHSVLNVNPRTRMFVDLGNGQPRYEIRHMGLNIEKTFFGLRAQHRNSKQYRDWASRLVDGAHVWFAPGNPAGEPQQLVEPPHNRHLETLLLHPQLFRQRPPLAIHQRPRFRVHHDLIRPGSP